VIVMKFGGTSVADADAIKRLIGIVRQQIEPMKSSSAPVVVVSALAGVTDKLVAIAQLAEDGAADRAASCVMATRRSVTPASADTTTTGADGDRRARISRSTIPIRRSIASASATEVPPNFITTLTGASCGGANDNRSV